MYTPLEVGKPHPDPECKSKAPIAAFLQIGITEDRWCFFDTDAHDFDTMCNVLADCLVRDPQTAELLVEAFNRAALRQLENRLEEQRLAANN